MACSCGALRVDFFGMPGPKLAQTVACAISGAEDRAHAAQPVQGVLCCKALHASHRLLLWSCIQPAASQLLHATGSACSYAGVVTHVDANVELGQEEWQQFRKNQMTLQEQVDKFRSLIYVGGSNEIVAGAVTCVVQVIALEARAHKPAGLLMWFTVAVW